MEPPPSSPSPSSPPPAAPDVGKRVNRGVAWAAAGQAVIALSDMISQVIVVALLISADDYGVATAGIAFYVLLDYAADFGVTSAIIQRDDHSRERLSTVFWFNVLVTTALFGVLLIVGPLYGAWQGNATVGWLLVAYGGKLLYQNVYAIPFALLRKELRFAEVAKARMAAHLCESAARIVFAALGFTVWCWTLAGLTRSFMFGVIVLIRHRFKPMWVFRPREILPYVKFGLRTAASQLLYQLYTNLDYAVVLKFFGDRANGIYALAYFIVLEPVKTIANVVIDVAFPAFAKLRNDRPALIEQFIQLTRLNVIAVLPFVVLILLVIPEFLMVFYGGGKWTDPELALCADAARLLCLVGLLRALGFLGPPLLDGVGRPELTLRYMLVATVAVPGMFVVGALVFSRWFEGDARLLAVAIGWAVGYPFAFGVLAYLIVKTIDLPVGTYLRRTWGMVGCCVAGGAAGLAMSIALHDAGVAVRMVAVGGTAVMVIVALVVKWQKITPSSIKAALR